MAGQDSWGQLRKHSVGSEGVRLLQVHVQSSLLLQGCIFISIIWLPCGNDWLCRLAWARMPDLGLKLQLEVPKPKRGDTGTVVFGPR